ncbi:hypothetical protein G7K_4542-t1 [Saitoella complicata NRRL Y-17804]|uniref:Uncharacterized protein n=1 Tax=Saitoella complicata (strain BCRC 22490 / CBS 7301 / JCM 7358 / NBRC 10748 / NRRL Y-17804) TaxID=698492 RepID=A0A0E9NL69_SAICN|nr:hypothetical protein G7K_4542-t1 [Saitoella complicata NRRL Y-17804]
MYHVCFNPTATEREMTSLNCMIRQGQQQYEIMQTKRPAPIVFSTSYRRSPSSHRNRSKSYPVLSSAL